MALREFLKYLEGQHLEAYQDTANIWTIGVGHTKDVKKDDKITQDQLEQFLSDDIKEAGKRIPPTLVNLQQGEWECLVSLAFNLTLKSFNKLLEHLKNDKELFKKKMLLYCKDVDGNYLLGLWKRRICERLIFEGRDWLITIKALETIASSKIYTKEQKKQKFMEIQNNLFGG